MTFASFNLNPALLKAVTEAGYTTPTPIQAAAIPLVLANRDLMGSAQTGTGKTAAFILPTLQQLTQHKAQHRNPRVLVLVPTRELALQVKNAAEKYAKHLRAVRIVSILGGMSYVTQHRQLAQPVDILIATPGRLIDHLERGRINLSQLEMLILDEADRMLDMGFLEAVKYIAAATPKTRQTLLFSATFDNVITKLAQHLLNNPERITITPQQTPHTQIVQHLHYADDRAHKNRLLFHFLKNDQVERAIIFTATKRAADDLAQTIRTQGYTTESLHGDMQQRVRLRTLSRLRQGTTQILVATDVAARGIDVAGISHIFNYDLPRTAEDYVHRVGRTGRAGAFGIAISLANVTEQQLVQRIERFIGHAITTPVIPGLEPQRLPQNSSSNHRKTKPAKQRAHAAAIKFKTRNKQQKHGSQNWRAAANHPGAKKYDKQKRA